MKFSVLSSGSKANSTFIRCGDTKILIDMGLSLRETERRLSLIGESLDGCDAVLVTHEHSDHMRGLFMAPKKVKIPVYMSPGTAKKVSISQKVITFTHGENFEIKDLEVRPFRIEHDAADPVGYTIFWRGIKFALVTDIGKVTNLVRAELANCNAIVVEANHDPKMLQECAYPWDLKRRIASSHGHLSNGECGDLLDHITHSDLKQVVLGHISKNSNTPTLAEQTVVERYAGNIPWNIECAGEESPTQYFQID